MQAGRIGLHIWHNAGIITIPHCIFSCLIIGEAGNLKENKMLEPKEITESEKDQQTTIHIHVAAATL